LRTTSDPKNQKKANQAKTLRKAHFQCSRSSFLCAQRARKEEVRSILGFSLFLVSLPERTVPLVCVQNGLKFPAYPSHTEVMSQTQFGLKTQLQVQTTVHGSIGAPRAPAKAECFIRIKGFVPHKIYNRFLIPKPGGLFSKICKQKKRLYPMAKLSS